MVDIGALHLFEPPAPTHLTLAGRFLVPPFSVLDARAGYWQDRKRDWLNLGIRGEEGRPAQLENASCAEDQATYRDRAKELLARDGFAPGAGRGEHLLGYSAAAEGVSTYSDERAAAAAAAALRDEIAATRGVAGDERGRATVLGANGRIGLGDGAKGLVGGGVSRAGYGPDYDLAKGENAWGGAGTSIFDPVVCELAYRWFSPLGGKVLDPFAGGSVRGIVAGCLERDYLGVDLRPEQCAANEQQRDAIHSATPFPYPPAWVCDDSLNLPYFVDAGAYDFAFSCPPYYDLEQYSDDPRDLSNADDYPAFRRAYQEIIWHTVAAMKPDRYACFVVGEVRDKTGAYCGLVPDTIRAFEAAGARLYNEGILVTSVGSLPIRTSRAFGVGRKLGKTHQNILVFCKGDGRKAADACGEVPEVALEYGGAVWRADGSAVTPEGERWAPE